MGGMKNTIIHSKMIYCVGTLIMKHNYYIVAGDINLQYSYVLHHKS